VPVDHVLSVRYTITNRYTDVDSSCNDNGPFKTALSLDVEIDVGLNVEVDSVFGDAENIFPLLYIEFHPYLHCWDLQLSAKKRAIKEACIVG
jgi:hypothetical protein